MAFAQFSKISCSFGANIILRGVSVSIAKGTKAALTGANGSGKTTLLKIMAGITESDEGERSIEKGARISYLPQSGIVHEGSTLVQEADKAFLFGYDIERELKAIEQSLSEMNNVPHNDAKNESETKSLLARHQELSEKLERSLWHRRSARIEQVLTGLGFSKNDFDSDVKEFSGGWQMRIALAKTLLENPDILLLDEPTNYLDIEARNWLEEFLINFSGGFLLVSHDRYFLDITVNCVYELFNGTLRRYPGNYSHYETVRQTELESLVERYKRQQEEIQRFEDFIRRFGAKATKAAAAQERQKMLDKMERIEIPETLKTMRFMFPPAPHSGRVVLSAEKISKSYDGTTRIIDSLDLTVEKGERLVIAGKNGAGKTTLLRILSGHDDSFEGSVKPGTGAAIGYFSQDNTEFLDDNASVIDFIEKQSPLSLIPKVRDMLGAFLFRSDDVFKNICVLSGGEKSRLALLSLLLRPVNVLILDEPTNHLDLHSKDVLLRALKDFGGTVLFVSHDRGFIESLATRVLELREGKSARVFHGDYAYYLERLEREKENANTAREEIHAAQNKPADVQAQKQEKAERRRLQREEERILTEISALEEKKNALHAELSKPEVYSDYEKSAAIQKEIDALTRKIEELSQSWETVSARLSV